MGQGEKNSINTVLCREENPSLRVADSFGHFTYQGVCEKGGPSLKIADSNKKKKQGLVQMIPNDNLYFLKN